MNSPSVEKATRPGATLWPAFALVIIVAAAILTAGAPDEKRVSIYSVAANYSLPVSQLGGKDYVGLLEVLEPLGTVSAKVSGSNWKLLYDGVESVFIAGGRRVHVRGNDFDLSDPFWLVNGRGLVPVSSLGALLPRILGGPVVFNEAARRVFIGNVAVHFTAQVIKSAPPRLVMNFSSPVNPTIATEPGKLRMTFNHEAVVAPGSQMLTFDSGVIPSAAFQERNGTAELLVSGTVPLLAMFSNDGRTITIAPPVTIAPPSPNPAPTTTATQPAPSTASPTPATPTAPAPASGGTRYFAVVDAAHGGDERGAALSDQMAEKDVTLAIARSLRQELMSRGLATMLVRDSDVTLTADQRASTANSVGAAVYICIHASSEGRGVRLYTSLLPTASDIRGPFLDWDTAQSSFRQMSETAAEGVTSELKGKQISTRTLAAALRPLNNVATAAIAVEVAPSGSDISQLNSSVYQQLIAAAIASGVADVRDKLRVELK